MICIYSFPCPPTYGSNNDNYAIIKQKVFDFFFCLPNEKLVLFQFSSVIKQAYIKVSPVSVLLPNNECNFSNSQSHCNDIWRAHLMISNDWNGTQRGTKILVQLQPCLQLQMVKKLLTDYLHCLIYDSKGFWRWCITFRITGFSDFVHRLVF
jgi:hypothetical protein